MDATVTIKIKIKDVCDYDDLKDISLLDMVKDIIKNEGLCGVMEDDFEIINANIE